MANIEVQNLFTLARRARDAGDNATAGKYYEQILLYDPNDFEAVFYSGYCAAACTIIRDIDSAAIRLKNTFNAAAPLAQQQLDDPTDALYAMCDDTCNLLANLSDAAYNHYMQYSTVNGALSEYQQRVYQCGMAAMAIGDFFYRIGDKRVACLSYKKGIAFWKGQYTPNDVALNRIKEYEPTYEPPKKAGCYVATCVYGSYDCPQVWTLRRYRDNTLHKTWYGRAFIRLYYAVSPTLVKWFGETNWFKKLWKGRLDKMVKKLNEEGVEDTAYDDLY